MSKNETEEKIKAILEHASKQQEIEHQHHQKQLGLLREVASLQTAPQQPQPVVQQPPLAKQPALSVYPAAPAAMQILQRPSPASITATAASTALTVTTTRPATVVVATPPAVTVVRPPPQAPSVVSVQKQPAVVAASAASTPQQQPLRPQIPPLANSPGLSVVQLPTQPLPASVIAQSSKQVLLEPKVSASPAAPKISIPSTSPRTGTGSISLPTQPVPLSAAQLTSVANAIVARTMTSVNPMHMLPNQPLPQITAAIAMAQQTNAIQQAQQQQQQVVKQQQPSVHAPQIQQQPKVPQPQHQQQQQQAPKLPQHPLPPTSNSTISVVSTRSASPMVNMQNKTTSAAVILPKSSHHVAPKKRVMAQAASEEEHFFKKENEPALIVIKKEAPYMKPRDVFGRGAHLVKEEKPHAVATSSSAASISKIIHQPPPPSSPSLATQEQHLSLIRDQEATIFFDALIKQGNPEHIAISLARDMAQDRYKNALAAAVAMSSNNDRPNSVPPNLFEQFRPSPMPAHMSAASDRQSQAASPAIAAHGPPPPMAAHAHSRISTSTPYMHDPYVDRHVIMNMNPPASPEPAQQTPRPNLDAHPMVWKGFLGLKNEFASVEFRYVSGCKDLANASLPHQDHVMASTATLRIGQRMRLETAHLSGVRTKMQQAAEHCVLLALPTGTDSLDMAAQSRQLRSHFITYLQLKGAAGIVNVPGDHGGHEGGYVVHVFPSCDFANETMTSIAPDLLAKVAEMEHMVIIIVTVLDKTANE